MKIRAEVSAPETHTRVGGVDHRRRGRGYAHRNNGATQCSMEQVNSPNTMMKEINMDIIMTHLLSAQDSSSV